MGFWLTRLKRGFDDKPIACHLYVTDNCNLDCFYCTEYDNSVRHPSFEDLAKWIRKIRELGCVRIGLQGGEPLLHPQVVEIVRYCKKLGLKTTMSSNGFRLTRELIQGLEDAGLDALQISVDRMTPIPSTRKSLKSLVPKLELLRASNIRFHISAVLFRDSLAEAREVLDYGLEREIPTHARLVHGGADGELAVERGSKEALQSLIDFQIEQKRKGRKIHSTGYLFDYQKSLLNGHKLDWTCVAGYKYVFVSAQGKFWLCSVNRQPNIDIMDVTPELLRSYFHRKECQDGCGVYCVVSESLVHRHPAKFAARELKERAQGRVARLITRK